MRTRSLAFHAFHAFHALTARLGCPVVGAGAFDEGGVIWVVGSGATQCSRTALPAAVLPRGLKVNTRESEHVRTLFERYLGLESVPALQDWARKAGIRSKSRSDRNRNPTGGAPFGRGALLHLLRNPVYLGKIVHKKTVHDGLHDAIVDETIFDAVQQRLDSKTSSRGEGGCADQAALTGRIFDATGERMSPTFAIGGSGRKYRYYVSTSLQKGARRSGDHQLRRVSARHVEAVITARLREIPSINQTAPLDLLRRVDLYDGFLVLTLPSSHAHGVAAILREEETFRPSADDRTLHQLTLPFQVETRGGKTKIAKGGTDGPSPDSILIRALREAHRMVERDHTGRPCILAAPTSPYRRKLIRLAFLAPHIQRAIMSGQQPPKLTLASLMAQDIPVCWQAQARVLGMPSP